MVFTVYVGLEETPFMLEALVSTAWLEFDLRSLEMDLWL